MLVTWRKLKTASTTEFRRYTVWEGIHPLKLTMPLMIFPPPGKVCPAGFHAPRCPEKPPSMLVRNALKRTTRKTSPENHAYCFPLCFARSLPPALQDEPKLSNHMVLIQSRQGIQTPSPSPGFFWAHGLASQPHQMQNRELVSNYSTKKKCVSLPPMRLSFRADHQIMSTN